MKKYLYFALVPVATIILTSIIFSILNLFKISIHPSLYLIIMILLSLTLGYLTGINCKDKGYLKGLICGAIFIAIMFLISIIITRDIKIFTLLYYLIILTSTTLASMIGVNKKN